MISKLRSVSGLALTFISIIGCSETTFRRSNMEAIHIDERVIGISWGRFTEREYDLVVFDDAALIFKANSSPAWTSGVPGRLDAKTASAVAQKTAEQLCGWNTKPDLSKTPHVEFAGHGYAYRIMCIDLPSD